MKRILLFLLAFNLASAKAQHSYLLRYMPDSAASALKLKTVFSSRLAAMDYTKSLPQTLQAKGYLAASVDSAAFDSTSAIIVFYTGPKFRWGKILVPAAYASLANRNEYQFSGLVNAADLPALQQKILDALANNGHPFASAGLDSVTVSGDSLYGKLSINEGPLYKIDSIHVTGLKLKPGFIYPYLHLTKAMPYNQQVLDKIEARLNELTFADVAAPWQLNMLGSGATAEIYLKPRRSNIINALIGVAPASTQTPNNKVLISGEANILLRNAFNAGESIGVNWQQLQYKSPRLSLLFNQPYLFGSKAGADIGFELFKKDTQFLNINLRAGVPYDFSGTKTGKVYFQQLTTNVIYTDTLQVLATRVLPELSNVSSANMGLEYEWNTTDYRRNPRRGLELFVTGIAGIKKIKTSNAITQLKDPREPGFNFSSLYDTVKLKTYQVRMRARLSTYISTGRLTVLKLALNGGWYQSQNYFRNELFQIGGFRLLRGFDEESIFARSYAVATAEYRFISGQNSYFFAFSDGGIAGYKDQRQQYTHGYIGAGLGLAIETKNSLVNLSWAAGKRNDQPLNLRQSKIHLGFINYF